jgi:hypothetical protein
MLLWLLGFGSRGEGDHTETKTRGGIATGLPVAGEYAIPATGAWKALLVLLINASRYLKVLVLFVEVALILSLKVGGQQVFTV